MKKIVVMAIGVLMSTLVFANGTDEPSGTSSVVVLNASGSNLFKVIYKAENQGTVKVSIFNVSHQVVFSETLRTTDGFIRPYNFDGLDAGTYTIEVEDNSGTQEERINVGISDRQPFIHLTKLEGEEDKYLLSGHFKGLESIQVRIYDSFQELVFDESRKVGGQFGEVYNLKNLPGTFTLEVSDQHGILKSVKF